MKPFGDLAPVDEELLASMGVPTEAVIDDVDGRRQLDLSYLRRLGWSIDEDSLSPPTHMLGESAGDVGGRD